MSDSLPGSVGDVFSHWRQCRSSPSSGTKLTGTDNVAADAIVTAAATAATANAPFPLLRGRRLARTLAATICSVWLRTCSARACALISIQTLPRTILNVPTVARRRDRPTDPLTDRPTECRAPRTSSPTPQMAMLPPCCCGATCTFASVLAWLRAPPSPPSHTRPHLWVRPLALTAMASSSVHSQLYR